MRQKAGLFVWTVAGVLVAGVLVAATGCSSSESTSDADTASGDSVTPDLGQEDLLGDLPGDLAPADSSNADQETTQTDQAADTAGPNACVQQLAHREPFQLFAEGGDTQIHVDVEFDGEAVWAAFNGPAEGSSSFAVYVTRIGCDGSVLVAPTLISNAEAGNQVDPELVVSGDRVLVAWQADSGIFPNNMDIVYRVFSVDGSDLTDVYGKVEPTVAGVAQPGSVWMPRAVAAQEGAFWMVASLAMESFQGFQMIVQPIGPTGLLTGPARHAKPEASFSQVYPAIGRGPDGSLLLVWSSESVEADTEVLYGWLPDGEPTMPAVYPVRQGPAYAGDLFTDPDGNGFLVYTADVGSESDVFVRPLDPQSAAVRSFGAQGAIDHTGVLQWAPGGGAVVWYRNVAGLKNNLMGQTFEYADGLFSVNQSSKQINVNYAAPYAPAVTHLGDRFYFFAWSEGDNPKYRVWGTFEEL